MMMMTITMMGVMKNKMMMMMMEVMGKKMMMMMIEMLLLLQTMASVIQWLLNTWRGHTRDALFFLATPLGTCLRLAS